ncbi:MAG: tryptophan synthase subunit alpha, partial [Acidobacteria bacterium]|nr:tryptophan synthase subunit alpha [Acidobacteriota bacterium]
PLAQRVRALTSLPLAVGFGISRPEHLAELAPIADAVVVGSAFMSLVEEHQTSPELAASLEQYTAHLKAGFRKTYGPVGLAR